jgi:hypothetical protein
MMGSWVHRCWYKCNEVKHTLGREQSAHGPVRKGAAHTWLCTWRLPLLPDPDIRVRQYATLQGSLQGT